MIRILFFLRFISFYSNFFLTPMPEIKSNVTDFGAQISQSIDFKVPVKGLDLEKGITLDDFIKSYETMGLQASHIYLAIQEIKRMRAVNARVYMGCTSNMMTCGIREYLKYLAKNKFFEIFVITGGGIEEDLIKCMAETYIGSFDCDGQQLRENGWNRAGNLMIHNNNYALFETWFNSIMDELLSGKTEDHPRKDINGKPCKYTRDAPLILTPSKFINYLGKKINNEDSVLYWCYKNNIHVYSPAITDGSLGDLLTFYNRNYAFKLDIVEDVHLMNLECLGERENGAIILGGGLIKHHILNGNLINDGLDYCVLVNTAISYDGSDAGASLGEAYSWGKVKPGRTAIKVYGEASIVFPLIAYGAFKSEKLD